MNRESSVSGWRIELVDRWSTLFQSDRDLKLYELIDLESSDNGQAKEQAIFHAGFHTCTRRMDGMNESTGLSANSVQQLEMNETGSLGYSGYAGRINGKESEAKKSVSPTAASLKIDDAATGRHQTRSHY